MHEKWNWEYEEDRRIIEEMRIADEAYMLQSKDDKQSVFWRLIGPLLGIIGLILSAICVGTY